MTLRGAALRIARLPLVGWLIRWSFTHMSFAIPVKRLYETETLLAFPHPRPSYALHILIVPKRDIGALTEVPPEDAALMRDLVKAVRHLVKTFNLQQAGYRLITNGGAYQDVPLLHFHLISDDVTVER